MTLQIGTRVVRGRDWKWHMQDNGEGHTGTVTMLGSRGHTFTPDRTTVVMWDFGRASTYRIGFQDCFDLAIIDSGPVGHHHPNVICDNCNELGIVGMRFKCKECASYDLCTKCYMADAHNLRHPFYRFNNYTDTGVLLPVREGSKKVMRVGMYPGATVARGQGWEWENQDGGDGKTGTVLNVKDWDRSSRHSVITVRWESGNIQIYRLGHNGKVDLKTVTEVQGGYYYPSHLPVAAKVENPTPLPDLQLECDFSVGDQVKVMLEPDLLEDLQMIHGGWNPRMLQYQGKVGTVHRVTVCGAVRVQYENCRNRWTIHPGALTKVSSKQWSPGDVVKISADENQVRRLQENHGGWIDNMIQILGLVGTVSEVDEEGDLHVQIVDRVVTLNPANCTKLDMNSTVLQTSPLTDRSSRLSLPDLTPLMAGNEIVSLAAQGKLNDIKRLLQREPRCVDNCEGGKTALHVACYHGNVNIINLLLGSGAKAELGDLHGDNALHYAVLGKHLGSVLDHLLQGSVDLVNSQNQSLQTALHLAVLTNQSQAVQMLIGKNADVNMQDMDGNTCFHLAINNNDPRIIKILVDSRKVNFELANAKGFNCLHQSALKGNLDVCSILVKGSRLLVDKQKDDGFTALHIAAHNGYTPLVHILIDQGRANVVLSTNRRYTALMLALKGGHMSVVEYLVEKGSDLDFQDEAGDTCLHLVSLVSDIKLNSKDTPALFKMRQEAESHIPSTVLLAAYLIQHGANEKLLNKNQQNGLYHLSADSILYVQKLTRRTLQPVGAAGAVGGAGEAVGGASSSVVKPIVEAPSGPVIQSECMVCEEGPATVIFHPCNDMIACITCSKRMKKCLHCKTPIESKENTVNSPKENQDSLIDKMEEQLQCSICLDRRKNVLFRCGHGACKECSGSIQFCHMCRKKIVDRINMY